MAINATEFVSLSILLVREPTDRSYHENYTSRNADETLAMSQTFETKDCFLQLEK